MDDVQVTVSVNGVKHGFTINHIDLDGKRNKLALEVGRVVVDAIWQASEGGN